MFCSALDFTTYATLLTACFHFDDILKVVVRDARKYGLHVFSFSAVTKRCDWINLNVKMPLALTTSKDEQTFCTSQLAI